MSEKDNALEVRRSTGDTLTMIAKVISDPSIDVSKMKELLEMQERIMDRQAKIDFADAMTRLQARLPHINRAGVIMNRDKVTVRSRYALIEDIDAVIRPLLEEEGFSISYNEEDTQGNLRKFSATLLHRAGHSVTKYKTMPFDQSDFRTAAQSEASTTSLARRLLLKMHLNLIEAGQDDDGQGGSAKITNDQVIDLLAKLDEVKADKRRFLEYMKVGSVDEILARDLTKAYTAIDAKKGRK